MFQVAYTTSVHQKLWYNVILEQGAHTVTTQYDDEEFNEFTEATNDYNSDGHWRPKQTQT